METTEIYFYVLKNKKNGKYFYESLWGGLVKVVGVGVKTIEELIGTHGYYYDKDTAKSDCKEYAIKYCLDLEVVKIKKIVRYEESQEDW